jgi:NADH dehydrogenase
MNIPKIGLKRIIIIGAGFGGVQVSKRLNKKKFQVILIDKNNYYTFQPLLYQVATFGLEPDSIAYTIRNIIKKKKNFHFRMAIVYKIYPKKKKIFTNIGNISYDYLIIATGSKTNYFGNKNIEYFSLPMKNIKEALNLRNCILSNFEKALLTKNFKKKEKLMNFIIVGGGPTGVELAGSLAEIKKYILPNNYPELNINHMKIYLIQATPRLLDGMSPHSAFFALKYLKKMGVNVWLNSPVKDYDGETIYMENKKLESFNVIWTAGVKGAIINGFNKQDFKCGRFFVNSYNKLINYKNIFAIGDVAYMKGDSNYPKGHPMTAQPAIQQGIFLAKNLNKLGKKMKSFKYKNLGSMAIIGRNKAICDFSFLKIRGFIAWLIWIFVHLINIVGLRNKIIILMNWIIQYFQYNKSIKLIIRYYKKKK